MKRLKEAPFTIDTEAIAQGLLAMFDDKERAALRFGMLPAARMEVVRNSFEIVFRKDAAVDPHGKYLGISSNGVVEFDMNKLLAEAMHEIALALYAIGDLIA